MSTCCSLNCPLILYCKHYNNNINRGKECKVQKEILIQVKKLLNVKIS